MDKLWNSVIFTDEFTDVEGFASKEARGALAQWLSWTKHGPVHWKKSCRFGLIPVWVHTWVLGWITIRGTYVSNQSPPPLSFSLSLSFSISLPLSLKKQYPHSWMIIYKKKLKVRWVEVCMHKMGYKMITVKADEYMGAYCTIISTFDDVWNGNLPWQIIKGKEAREWR